MYRRGKSYSFAFSCCGQRIQKSPGVKDREEAMKIAKLAYTQLVEGRWGAAEDPRAVTVNELLNKLESGYKRAGTLSPQEVSTLQPAYTAAKCPAPEILPLSEPDNVRQAFFCDDEFRLVHSHLPPDLADFALFGYLTGWRKNEIASLTWNEVADGVIRLRGQNAINREGGFIAIRGELVGLMARCKDTRYITTPNGFDLDGEPIAGLRRSRRTACKRAGVA